MKTKCKIKGCNKDSEGYVYCEEHEKDHIVKKSDLQTKDKKV